MAAQPAASPSVYVGDLDAKVTEANLYEHFRQVGSVMSVRVCLDSQSQKSLGYGYVNFQNPNDAERAIEELNGSRIHDRPIRVTRIQRDPAQRKSGVTNVVIKGLAKDTDWSAVKELFSKFGKIFSMKVPTDENGLSRGYAYVMFDREEAAAQAVNDMNGSEINNESITVERYKNPAAAREEAARNFTNLYVKNIDKNLSDVQFSELFSQIGEVTSAKVRLSDEGFGNAGYGFIAFKEHTAALAAIEHFNDKTDHAQEGMLLVVKRFENKRERARLREQAWRERKAMYDKYPNLYIKNFDDSITSEKLREVFERYGETVSVRVQIDPVTKISRGFGFVSYKEPSMAEKAIAALVGSLELGPRPLFVAYAQRRDARRQQFEEMQKKRAQRPIGFGPMMSQPVMMPGGMIQQPQAMYRMQQGFPAQMMPGQQLTRPMQPLPGQQLGAMNSAALMQQQAMMARMPRAQPQPPPTRPPHPSGLDAQYLASLAPEQQKNILGERLYAFIIKKHPASASKITGMLLEMDNSEILNLLDSPALLDSKVTEAIEVLARHGVSAM